MVLHLIGKQSLTCHEAEPIIPADRLRRPLNSNVSPQNSMIDLQAINHTNRELELMLEGRKPLAVFCDEISVLPHEEIIPEERFRPYVESGIFVRGEGEFNGGFHSGLGRDAIIRYVLFAKKDEAWRIPAYLLMRKVFYKLRYTEELERIESELLGYEDHEIDAWCDHVFRRNAG